MRLRFPLALVLTLAVTSPAPAAVVVVANFTPAEIAFTVADPGGKPPERDARPEANPAPRTPVKVRVTLLVDDADPRADRLWQAAVRKRLDDAAAVIEATSTFRLEFAGFATWKSDPTAFDFAALFPDFQDKVKVKPGEIAVGFTSLGSFSTFFQKSCAMSPREWRISRGRAVEENSKIEEVFLTAPE